MHEPTKIYLAGPLGFSEVGRLFHENEIIPLLEGEGHIVLDPWKLTDKERIDRVNALPFGEAKRRKWKSLNLIMGRNNARAIARSDMVFAVLDGVDVDSGTAAEIGYAYALRKPIIGYRGDFRLSADNEGSTVNLQVEYFIRANGGSIIRSVANLPFALAKVERRLRRSKRRSPR